MSDAPDTNEERLDSWKAIAEYLRRDVATARRWEKTLGLPVYRVSGGRGRSVFAYKREIDRWLADGGDSPEVTSAPADGRDQFAVDEARSIWRLSGARLWIGAGAVALVIATAVVVLWTFSGTRVRVESLRVDVTEQGVVARDISGQEQWRYLFPGTSRTIPASGAGLIVPGDRAAMYVATSYTLSKLDQTVGSGELLEFEPGGRLRRTFSFADEVAVSGKAYGPPWAVTAFQVDDHAGRRRVAIAAHHYIWSPSLVTILDDAWQRVGTFVHNGWIENVHWLGNDRLLAGGFSNDRDSGLVALLDPASMSAPLLMVAMPRSEVNKAAGARFNRAVVQLAEDRVVVRTIESTSGDLAAEAIYEFDRSLALGAASFSTLYWDTHRALEHEGKLDHPRERCPDRDGPRNVAIWTPETGWTDRRLTPTN